MKAFLKWLGIVVAMILVFAILIAAFYGIEDWRGKRAWERCKAELEARGEKLDAKDFIPPSIPDDQNFAASPLFQPLFDYKREHGEIVYRDQKAVDHLKSISVYDHGETGEAVNHHPTFGNWHEGKSTDLAAWQTYYQKSKDFPHPATPQDAAHDVLFALAKYDPEIAILSLTASRPKSRYPLHYEEGFAMPAPQIMVLRSLTEILRLRASAHLALNETDAALDAIRLQLRLASSLNNESALISSLVKNSMFQMTLQPIWEGVANHQWSSSQLAELSRQIQQFDFLKDFQQTIRFERAFGFNLGMMMLKNGRDPFEGLPKERVGESDFTNSIKKALIPKGWIYQEQAFGNRFIQNDILPQVDDARQRIHKDLRKNAMKKLGGWEKTYYDKTTGDFFLGTLYENSVFTAAQIQTDRDLALTAIALEEYRLANHDLPATLDALAPQFLAHIPHDVMNGEPLKYRRESNERYALYSVGWNGTDDGGKVAFQKDSPSRIDFNEGDWIWPMPAAPSTQSQSR